MLRLLLVDDHEDSRMLHEEVLRDLGCEIVTAPDGRTALDLLAGGEFHVAVVDIGLPDIDGYELARRARLELGERTPMLLAMTGYGSTDHVEAAKDAGFDVHLTKPVDIERLRATVQAALEARGAPEEVR